MTWMDKYRKGKRYRKIQSTRKQYCCSVCGVCARRNKGSDLS